MDPETFFAENGGVFAEGDFASEDRRELLSAWLAQVADEEASVQRAYVNWRGHRHIVRRLMRQPARLDFEDQGERQMLASQLEYFRTQEQIARERVPQRLINEVEGERTQGEEQEGEHPLRRSPLRRSRSVAAQTCW